MELRHLASHRLCDVIELDPQILFVMSRFGLSLGFGDKTVEAVCSEQEVDTATFLAVANFITFKEETVDGLSLEALMSYLENAHSYFLDFSIPAIKRRLIEAIGAGADSELAILILKFYEDYAAEVRRHMDYESTKVFTYVRDLIGGVRDEDFSIDLFARHHHSIHQKLKELKNILIRFLPQRDNNLLNAALFDIISCEHDLMDHCRVEDRIFVPCVRTLEAGTPPGAFTASAELPEQEPESEGTVAEASTAISSRERDIIRCVAMGLSNKEIAAQLFISVNTVTTHRRNIVQKLGIHSSAGLTIYAVLNSIVNIEDLSSIK